MWVYNGPAMEIPLKRREALESLAEEFGVAMILAFGSVVRGAEHAASDLDLALRFRTAQPDLDAYLRLTEALRNVFGGREIDWVVLERADPLLLKKIAEDCALLVGSTRDFHEFRMHAFKRYQDHKRFLAMERRFLDRFLTEGSLHDR